MDLLCCPVCKGKLMQKEHEFRCEAGHSFDIAKQGYVNLLMSQRSSARNHGDDKEMVASRCAFLEKGYYSLLRDALQKEVSFYTQKKHPVLVDAGCGEGWYTQGIAKCLHDPIVIGFDISKNALKWAAKRQGFASLAVASCFSIPLEDQSVDCLLNIFSPLAGAEYQRVLKEGGHLFRVVPGKAHLWELKEAIYEHAIPNRPEPQEIEGLTLIDKKEICYEIHLKNNADIMALFQMTPYYYRTSPQDHQKLKEFDSLTTRVEFEILIYKK